jgi:hypothetical protein
MKGVTDVTPEQFAEKAKADAVAKGATPEAADAAYATALAEAKKVMGHPLYQGLQTVNQEISGRAAGFKKQLDDAKPILEAGQKALDANKTATDKLTETERLLNEERQARSKERRDTAVRLAAAKAGVKNPDLVLKLVDAGALKEGEGGAIMGADEAVAKVIKDVPGLVGEKVPGRSPGPGGAGGDNGTQSMKDYVGDGSDVGSFGKRLEDVREKKVALSEA